MRLSEYKMKDLICVFLVLDEMLPTPVAQAADYPIRGRQGPGSIFKLAVTYQRCNFGTSCSLCGAMRYAGLE